MKHWPVVLTACSFLIMITFLKGDTVHGQQKRPRQRIALNGLVSHGITGIPRWAQGETALAGEPGDLFILRTTASPGERLEVGVYFYQRRVDENDQPLSNWAGVPASQRGIDWQYRSQTMGCVCAVVRFVNPNQQESDFDLPLFLPYAATALSHARYQFAYLIQVRANGTLVDNFWGDCIQVGVIGPSGLIRGGISYCCATSGPCLTPFQLQGTTDSQPLIPLPESVPESARSN
jgi:hypothetical protein